MPDLSIDPDSLPRDWRRVVKAGAFVIVLGMGVMMLGAIVSAPVAKAEIAPIAHRLDLVEDNLVGHLSETKASRPVMERYVEEQRRINCGIARNIYELCRLNSQARCVPMGASCP